MVIHGCTKGCIFLMTETLVIFNRCKIEPYYLCVKNPMFLADYVSE